MKKMMAAFIAMAFWATSAYAIEGSYNVSGNDPYEKTNYKGTVEITKDKNDVYQAKWNIDGEETLGTGLKTDNMISFGFKVSDVAKSKEQGVVVYKIGKDSLDGSFVYLGQSLVGKEKLVKR